MNMLSGYPDIVKEALIPMIIAILGLSFPLLIQTISRIDDKYGSTKLIEVFRRDDISNCFLTVVACTVVVYLLWILQLKPLINYGWVIDNSALILILLCTFALLGAFCAIIYLIYIYYVPELLLKRLIRNYEKSQGKDDRISYFNAISRILFYSINKADEKLARDLMDYYCDVFVKHREGKEGVPIEYPEEYYDVFFEANEMLCARKKKTISYYNDGVFIELFLDQYQKTIISQKTYRFLWKLLVQSIQYDKTDTVLSYWRKAHQLFCFNMQQISPIYDSSYSIKTNQSEIDKRNEERDDFLEFHYALGGLLMYKKQYSKIREIMNFTNSEPPKYVLVPERMEEVIERYMQIGKEYLSPVYYLQRYVFPDIYGVNADMTIRMWIKRYLAILFIRQYTLHEYYINSNPLKLPNPPQKLSELKRWEEELSGLTDFVNEYLFQKDVLKNVGLEHLSDPDWFVNNNKITPSDLIEKFKTSIKNKFNKTKANQSIDFSKKDDFIKSTIECLTPVFEKFSTLFSNNGIGDNYKSFSIGGQNYILEKAAFSDNQDVSYMNTDSITAQSVALQFQYYVLNFFAITTPIEYTLMERDLFLAIDRLCINKSDFVIIAIGINIEYYSYFQIKGLKKKNNGWYYNNIKIVDINSHINEWVNRSLFILKKSDLPNLEFKEVAPQLVKKYQLNLINKPYKVYSSLINLNDQTNEQIRKEVEQANNSTDLSKAVLACVQINAEIKYKEEIKYIRLKVHSQFDDRGNANSLNEITGYEN